MNNTDLTYGSMFPYDTIRESQRVAIDFAIDTFLEKKKKFCIIEAGTGVGKSAVGVTVARVVCDQLQENDKAGPGAYFLTTQKILQDQYVSDFKSISSIKSSGNYGCSFHKKNTCAESQQLLRTEQKGTKFFKSCAFNCVYKKEKQKFLDASESVTNFPYFMTEANYSGKITPRQVLVIDEGHNIEAELSRFVEISVSQHFAKNLLGLNFPTSPTQYRVFKWITDSYLPAANRKIAHIEKMIARYGGEKFREKLSQFQKITRQFDLLKSHVSKLDNFVKIYSGENWVFEISRTDSRGTLKATFKPIDVSPYAQDALFNRGEKVLIMSATIIDKNTFCKTLGIQASDCEFISIPSPFKAENRPVIFSSVGSMSAKNIEKTLPKLALAVSEILEHHKYEKGIIHCKTFKIAKYIKQNVKSTRFIVHDSSNRDEMLEKHIKSKRPTVLLSPSMTEGVDLKGDSSRFQILCKVPYPYLGDRLVKKRMHKFPGWYDLQTAKSIVQSAGRSVRSSDDHASTYILDADFERFLNKNINLFPKDFLKCLMG